VVRQRIGATPNSNGHHRRAVELGTDERRESRLPAHRGVLYLIGGTHGFLTVPPLDLWRNQDTRSWWQPRHRERVPVAASDPLVLQIRHFCRVIRGQEEPLMTGRGGLNTLKVVVSVKEAAASGQVVHIQ
jgi:predicted dehydrogenase